MSPAQFIDDPNWADFIPERVDAPRLRAVPTHEDCSPLDPETSSAHLRCGGTLGGMPGYEERPGQIDMLEAIVRAFNAKEHLMIEAGTGVGKSLAYLIPSMLWSQLNDTPVIVATATRNLQSQLIKSDIPRARAVLGEAGPKFRVALLKGRGNYLCLREVSEFFSGGLWTMPEEQQAEMPHFIEWLQTTPDGDLDGYDGLPRSLLSCPGEECGGRHCPYFSRCFVYRARKLAAEANLVIANHALVLAEGTGGGILPPYGRLIVDEAHNLEDTATEYLSREFSLPALNRLMNRLMRAGRGKRARPSGMLAVVERGLKKGLYTVAATKISQHLSAVLSARVSVQNAANELASLANHFLLPVLAKESTIRYRMKGGVRQHSINGLFGNYDSAELNERELANAESQLENTLASLVNLLHDLCNALEEEEEATGQSGAADIMTQLSGMAESFVAFMNDTHFVLAGAKETHAYWAERVKTENRSPYVRLVAAPLSVAEDLRRMLYETKDSVILSSATLRVGSNFTYMARRLGFCDKPASETTESTPPSGRYRALTADSPFDYLRQALVLAPDYLPDPGTNATGYAAALARALQDICTATVGRALVLFTSYEMMETVAVHARAPLEAAGIELLVQGEGLSRETMTARLRGADEKSVVLFGAQSFWEGVDIPGAALSCVVLARLPFAQRTNPIIEARCQAIDTAGGTGRSKASFHDYYLPEAVIRFRQGFGRLIRMRTDRGVVIVTDPRIVTKPYGAIFRRSIPASVHTVTSLDELLSRTTTFLENDLS